MRGGYACPAVSSNFVRVGVLAALTALLLVSTASAAAAYAPTLVVTPIQAASAAAAPGAASTAATGVKIDVRAAADDDATARAVLYVPPGYRLGRPAPGEAIGKASGTALTASGATVALGGTVVGAAADAASVACVPTGATVWLLQLARSGTLIHIPLVVTDPPASASAFASATITACFPPPSGAETGGLRLLSATFALGGTSVIPPQASGTYRWRAQLTPWAADAATEAARGTVEAQSIVRLPTTLTVSARLVVQRTPVDVKVTRTVRGKPVTAVERRVLVTRFADVSGRVLEAGHAVADAGVLVYGASTPSALRRLTRATPDPATGAFAVRVQLDTTAKAVFLQTRLAIGARDLGAAACTPSFGAAVPCVSASAPALRLQSLVVRLATGR